jgi:hypothetical protein
MNHSPRVAMSLHSDTLSCFRTNQPRDNYINNRLEYTHEHIHFFQLENLKFKILTCRVFHACAHTVLVKVVSLKAVDPMFEYNYILVGSETG